MDHKDRLEGRIPSHPGTRQHPQILPVRCSRDSLSIPGPPVWTIDSSTGIHQDSSPCDPAASFSRHPSPRLLGRLDNSCHFSRTKSGTYTTHYTTSPITGMDNQLEQINVATLQNPGLSGFTFQLRTGPHIPSGLVLTNSHRGPIPSISVDGHVCSESFIHHQPDVTLCPIYIQRPSSSSVSPVLIQTTVDSTSTVVGYSNPVGCGLPLLPALVSKSNSNDRGSVTSSGPQSVLLHGCISQRLGSQLEKPSDFRTMVNSRLPTSYQLVGTGGGPTCSTSMGSSVETSDCQSLLRQQYGSSIHPQTRGNTFPVPISKNSGTVWTPGSVCDNSHTQTPPRSQERHSRCSVPSQSAPVEHTSLDPSLRHPTVPVFAQNTAPSISPRSQTIGSSRVELIRDVLKRHHFPDTVVDMAADPLRDSSSNVYNSQWKAFALWANNKGILPNDLSFITLAECLVYLFSQNKKVNTILVHKASISSVLKLLNPPTAIQESTLHNVIRRMTILRPREQEVLPRWHLSVVLKGLMKPPFAINGTDRHISLELLSYKTVFLVALASGARGSELVALSRASHNLEFTTLASGVKHVSIRMVPKFIPQNQRPEIIPEPIKFPGIAPRHGGRYGTTGHPSGGRTDGFPVIWGPLLITRHLHQCRLTLVVYQWQVRTFQ